MNLFVEISYCTGTFPDLINKVNSAALAILLFIDVVFAVSPPTFTITLFFSILSISNSVPPIVYTPIFFVGSVSVFSSAVVPSAFSSLSFFSASFLLSASSILDTSSSKIA